MNSLFRFNVSAAEVLLRMQVNLVLGVSPIIITKVSFCTELTPKHFERIRYLRFVEGLVGGLGRGVLLKVHRLILLESHLACHACVLFGGEAGRVDAVGMREKLS